MFTFEVSYWELQVDDRCIVLCLRFCLLLCWSLGGYVSIVEEMRKEKFIMCGCCISVVCGVVRFKMVVVDEEVKCLSLKR